MTETLPGMTPRPRADPHLALLDYTYQIFGLMGWTIRPPTNDPSSRLVGTLLTGSLAAAALFLRAELPDRDSLLGQREDRARCSDAVQDVLAKRY
jgi:hypothetical protein